MSVILEPRIHRIRTLQRVYLELRRDLPFLEERIHLLRVVVADHSDLTGHPTTSHPALSEHCRDLGAALYDRYHHVRELEDLNEAAKFLRFALTLPHPLGKAAFPAPGSLLGSVLREHGHVTRNPQLCEEALSLHRQSMECSSNASTLEIAHHSRELGLTLRCHPSEDTRALSASVAHLKESRELYTDNQVTDHFSLLGLCEAMVSQYYAQPDKIYMDRAISYGELALTLCGSAHRDFFRISERLAYVHRGHAWLFENIESLDTSVVLSRTALLDASPRWTLLLALGLTSTLQVRFARLGHQEDLDEAVRCVTMLPKDTTPNDVDWCQLQDCTSWTMLLQFMTTGIPEHIEAAVYAADLACSAVTLVGSTRHLHTLQQSALCHTEQYNAFGDAAHLNKSIELLEYVMELAPPDSMNWRAAAKFILESLHERYKATGDTADLERAIALVPILQATRNKKELLASFELKVAGDVILSHYSVTGALADLDQATKIHWEAVQNCTSYRRHEVLCAYSATLRVRYEALLEKECAIEGLELQNQAYNDLPDVYPYRAGVLCGLSRWKLCISSGQPHVEEALDHLLAALDHSYSPAYQRLKDVSDVLSYLATRKAHLSHENASKLSFVYAAAIALLPQVASFGLEPRVRLAVISDAGQLTMQGAVHAIANEQLGLALEMLEAGRNVFWTQGLHLRTPFADLPDSMRDLLTKITYALARPFPDKLIGAKKDRELARRRRLGDDFRSALAEARQVPGCEDILLNASFESLVQVARHLTVILVASNSSGHAIVIREAQCHLVTLAQATTSTLQALSLRIGGHARAVRSSRGMRLVNTVKKDATAAYRELWTLVMQPIVAALQLSKGRGRQRQRLTLCPTGIFMQLPLHAAGIYTGKNQVCCSDYFVSSYTPSIAALLHAQKSLQPVRRSDATTLLVAVDQPLQGTALAMTRKEAYVVQKHVSMSSEVIQASTCNEVLEHIQAASIVHLACHGTQNPSDALQSGFHLEDGLLSVSKLMELQLPRAFLAVLGACETAKGDATQPDQAIHLAAAMLFAGFKSVVATMWFMGDLEGPVVAEGIYSALFKEGNASEHLDPEDVPYALDDVVRKLRESGLDPSFWATYVHIGV